jgi:hypothetical protein
VTAILEVNGNTYIYVTVRVAAAHVLAYFAKVTAKVLVPYSLLYRVHTWVG